MHQYSSDIDQFAWRGALLRGACGERAGAVCWRPSSGGQQGGEVLRVRGS